MATEKTFTAQELFDEAFSQPRNPRSEVYKQGWLAGANAVLHGLVAETIGPYKLGTVESDAWWAGALEGAYYTRGRLSGSPPARPQSDLRTL